MLRKRIYVAGICRNPAFPEMPRQFRKCLGFPQLPRQLQNKISVAFIWAMLKIWEKAEH
jgi:hypothetical protein